jgi:hypothetical protein
LVKLNIIDYQYVPSVKKLDVCGKVERLIAEILFIMRYYTPNALALAWRKASRMSEGLAV